MVYTINIDAANFLKLSPSVSFADSSLPEGAKALTWIVIVSLSV